uniref:Polysaccharide chain length determinant N-terminal domain-containing protein n=1 Tax=Ignavibacterium album TaxID=591197 RepID=A0A832DJE2_9BACT
MDFHTIVHTILVNWKRIISVTILSMILLFLIFMFVYPITYTSSVTILPPERKKDFGLGGLLGSGSDLSSLSLGTLSIASSEIYIQILKSRTVSEFVVNKLKLKEKFNVDTEQEAVGKLQNMISTDLNKEGIVKLSVDVTSGLFPSILSNKDSLKSEAQLIAKTLIEGLDFVNNSKISNKSKRTRIYLEGQLELTKATLDSVEKALVEFQQKNKTVSLPEQMKSSLEAAAKLKSEITRIEIEMSLLKNDVTEENKYFNSLKKQLEELRNQYYKFDTDRIDYLVSFKNAPELGREFSSLYREVRIQNEIYVMLQQMYYKEKIQEKRDLPTVDILDEPIKPDKPSSPRMIFSSVIGGIFIFIGLSAFYIYKESLLSKAKALNR